MSYTKQNFQDGKVLTADNLNLIEDGIVSVHEELNNKANAIHTHDNYAAKVKVTGAGNAITAISQSGDTITATKSVTFLTDETPLSKGTDTSGQATTLGYGDSFTVMTDTAVDNHKITDQNTTFTLPRETIIAVDQKNEADQLLLPGNKITLVSSVTKGDSSHKIDVTKVSYTLPQETTLNIGAATGEGNAVTDITVNNHTIYLTKGNNFSLEGHEHTIEDINDFPTIPSKLADLAEDTNHRTVTDNEKNIWNTTISGTVTKEIGGIAKNTEYSNATIASVLNDLLFPYVAPIFSSISTSASSGTFEYGTIREIKTVTPTFTKGSKPINSIKIGTASGGSDLYSGTTATSDETITLTTSKVFDGSAGGTIYCTISDGTESKSASASVSYKYYEYSKLTTNDTPDTSGATKQTSSGADNTYSYTAGQYLWLYSKSNGKKIQTYVAGSWADVATTTSAAITLTLASGATATYYAYRTDKFAGAGSARYRLA